MKINITAIVFMLIVAGCASTAPQTRHQDAAPAHPNAAASARSGEKVGVSGEWLFEVNTDQGSGSPTFRFDQKGEELTGQYQGMFGAQPVVGTVKGNEIEFSFSVDFSGEKVTFVYSGTVDGNTMKGEVKADGNGTSSLTGSFTGERK